MNDQKVFWDQAFLVNNQIQEPTADILDSLRAAQTYFGELSGRTVLDVGAGRGESSIFFAQLGARVISVDQSAIAMANLANYCEHQNIENILPMTADLFEIANLGPVDFIFGSMVLHHVEPLEPFVKIVKAVLAPNGRAFFYENNGSSRLLLWCRRNLVGKMGIPKYGDQSESPLAPEEVEVIRRHFEVKQDFPFMNFFQLISLYFLRGNFRALLKKVDQALHRIQAFRRYSYRQYLYLSKVQAA